MKTLKQLIEEGLPVGALVQHIHYRIKMQLHTDSRWYVLKKGKYLAQESIYHILESWQPTTAHDSGIDPKTLPIPEPFWTGWVYDSTWKEVVEIQHDYFLDKGELWTYRNEFLLKSDCRPCLPPK